jgi:hypothetical protein
MHPRREQQFVADPHHHRISWFQFPTGLMTKFLFVPRPLIHLELGTPPFDERKGWSFWVGITFVSLQFSMSVSALTQLPGKGIILYGYHIYFVTLLQQITLV